MKLIEAYTDFEYFGEEVEFLNHSSVFFTKKGNLRDSFQYRCNKPFYLKLYKTLLAMKLKQPTKTKGSISINFVKSTAKVHFA